MLKVCPECGRAVSEFAEMPSDLPPWSKDKTMIIRPITKNTMSNAFMLFPPLCFNTLSQ